MDEKTRKQMDKTNDTWHQKRPKKKLLSGPQKKRVTSARKSSPVILKLDTFGETEKDTSVYQKTLCRFIYKVYEVWL